MKLFRASTQLTTGISLSGDSSGYSDAFQQFSSQLFKDLKFLYNINSNIGSAGSSSAAGGSGAADYLMLAYRLAEERAVEVSASI